MSAMAMAKKVESRDMCVIAPVTALASRSRDRADGGVEDNEQPLY
jgi:hypothetical protein